MAVVGDDIGITWSSANNIFRSINNWDSWIPIWQVAPNKVGANQVAAYSSTGHRWVNQFNSIVLIAGNDIASSLFNGTDFIGWAFSNDDPIVIRYGCASSSIETDDVILNEVGIGIG